MADNCQQCGRQNDPSAKFCVDCGAQLRRVCHACSSLIDVQVKFCPECGKPQSNAAAENQTTSEADWQPSSERRQVTVMFLDLVGSTALSAQLDAEDWREMLLEYQAVSVRAIEDVGGKVSRYLGDGMMVYFGFPQALEDAQQRAARAALAILDAIEALNESRFAALGIKLKVRIGIDVGRVITGEMGAGSTRESMDIVGATPNIAARLESLAPADCILLSAAVAERIAGHFELKAWGRQSLKGIAEPIEVFQLLGAKEHVRAVRVPAADVIYTGRETELATLAESWREAVEQRQPKLAIVEGEAGMGKSGLLQLFLDHPSMVDEKTVIWACSVFDSDTPLIPVWRRLAEDFGLQPDETEAQTSARIDAGLSICAEAEREALATVAEALLEHIHGRIRKSEGKEGDGGAGRRELFRALNDCLRHRADPLLLVLEDAHWADPSTLDLVDRILRQGTDWAVMLLVLTRPNDKPPWADIEGPRLALGGLPSDDCEKIILRLSQGKPMERALVERIIDSTDGTPLFVEELTKSILESGKLEERMGRLVLPSEASEFEAPGSLLDLLTVRLDGLGPAKETAQTAAVIGRGFRQDALSHMTGLPVDQVQAHLETLLLSGIVSRRSDSVAARYFFRHALYQKVAYESLLRRRRLLLHSAYLAWLEANPVAKSALLREQLAFHSQRAGQDDVAVTYWIEAGENATAASASQEAVRHFESGLRLLRDMPSSAENKILTLRLSALLGGALMMSKGPGAPETRVAYDRALKLCEELPQTQWHFPIYWGWWRISANFNVMLKRAERLVEIAETMNDLEYKLQAHHCLWVNAYMVGDHKTVLAHTAVGFDLYAEGNFSQSGSLYGGHDPKICGLGEKALSLWLMGQADEAFDTVKICLSWAEELGHLGSQLHALDIAVMLYHFRSDLDDVARIAARLREISDRQELDDYRAKADIFDGWCKLQGGDAAAGSALLEEGVAAMRLIGSREDFPVYFAMVAESRLRQKKPKEAIQLLTEGLEVVTQEGVAYWAPEIHRLSAEALWALEGQDAKAVDDHLEKALQMAEAQGALALVLRTTISKAQLLQLRGQTAAGLAALAAVLDRFQEGEGTRDLVVARKLAADIAANIGSDSHELA